MKNKVIRIDDQTFKCGDWTVRSVYSTDPNAPYFEDLFLKFLLDYAQNTDV